MTTTLLAAGFHFGECPRWHDDRLWFSDQWGMAVHSVSLAGDLRTEFRHDDRLSGLGWQPDGTLLVVSMHRRQLLARRADGLLALHADLSALATGHCNDMVVDAGGRAYVGNFGFDLDAEVTARGIDSVFADHPTASLIRVEPDGRASIAADDLHFPNGAVITPDGKTLILGETLGRRYTAFRIAADGALHDRRPWADVAPRVPDGCALDSEGAIWMANPIAPECVRIAPGGAVLAVIDTGQPCYACMLGGPDGRTLFMLTAPSFMSSAVSEPLGELRIATAPAPHAGRP